STDDAAAAARMDHVYNLLFLDAVATGMFDTGLVGTGPTEQHSSWEGTLDFIGVDYFDTDVVIASPGLLSPLDAVPCAPAFRDVSPAIFASLGCPDDSPDPVAGMTKILVEYQQRYQRPMLITQNGFTGDEMQKTRGVVRTLSAVHDAIMQGANV